MRLVVVVFGAIFCPAFVGLAQSAVAQSAATPNATTSESTEPTWERCDASATEADYGSFAVGQEVVLGRHRIIGGRENWDPAMNSFVGRVAHIAQLAARDSQGCLGVRVDVDAQAHFWRLRDLRTPAPAAFRAFAAMSATTGFPQACTGAPNYGGLRVGATVVVGRPRPGMNPNWAPEMDSIVGRRARVIELVGTDGDGCAGVHLDVDEGEYFWRVRDLSGADGSQVAATSSAGQTPGLLHGRPPPVPTEVLSIFGATPIPEQCGQNASSATFGPVTVSAEVLVGRHRPVDGQTNWDPSMDAAVGRTAHVLETVGVDDQGCPVVRLDLDGGAHFWRIRDMQMSGSAQGGQSLSIGASFAPNPLILRGQAGGSVDASTLDPSCPGHVATLPNVTLTVTATIGLLRVLVNSGTDTTLVVQDPAGQFHCTDDDEGVNPIVELQRAGTGVYRIWVGLYSSSSPARYTLGLTTRSDLTTMTLH